jgi:hypothetical protein
LGRDGDDGCRGLWILTTEEIHHYWYCSHRYTQLPENWTYYSNMYISIFWALYGAILMVAGFAKHLRFVRYLALGLFALLLAKVFLIDGEHRIRNVYGSGFLDARILIRDLETLLGERSPGD